MKAPLTLQTSPQQPTTETILKSAASIGVAGAASGSVPRLMAALCDPDVSAAVVEDLVERDPVLSLRVLRIANSAYYGQSRSIAKIERALKLLGLDAVRGIAAAACLDRVLTVGTDAGIVDPKLLMQHSRATAAAAESLASMRRPTRRADAFIAGLLHNFGTSVQLHLDPVRARAMIGLRAGDFSLGIREIEASSGAVSHEQCGAVIFAAWNLPETLIAATRHHHDPMAAPEAQRDLAALVHVGAHIALAGGYTFELEPSSNCCDPAAFARLGLETGDIEAVAEVLDERVIALEQALAGA